MIQAIPIAVQPGKCRHRISLARRRPFSREQALEDSSTTLLWFRRDLRLNDNPALAAAIATGRPVLCCYVLDEASPATGGVGAAARWWLHHSLAALKTDLERRGMPLLLRRGPAARVLAELARQADVQTVMANDIPEPAESARDGILCRELAEAGLTLHLLTGRNLLYPPPAPLNGSGGPYKVFTPFWRACMARPEPMPPLPAPPPSGAPPAPNLTSEALADWRLLPHAPDWSTGFQVCWTPGEAGALDRLAGFLSGPAQRYGTDRDLPDGETTSRLSPHLHWGEVSANRVWHALRAAQSAGAVSDRHGDKFLAELGWREFAHHLLHHLDRKSVV